MIYVFEWFPAQTHFTKSRAQLCIRHTSGTVIHKEKTEKKLNREVNERQRRKIRMEARVTRRSARGGHAVLADINGAPELANAKSRTRKQLPHQKKSSTDTVELEPAQQRASSPSIARRKGKKHHDQAQQQQMSATNNDGNQIAGSADAHLLQAEKENILVSERILSSTSIARVVKRPLAHSTPQKGSCCTG